MHLHHAGRSWSGTADESGLSKSSPSSVPLAPGSLSRLARVRRALEDVRGSGWELVAPARAPARVHVRTDASGGLALIFTEACGARAAGGKKGGAFSWMKGGIPLDYAVVALERREDARAFLTCATERAVAERVLLEATRKAQVEVKAERRALDRAVESVQMVAGHREEEVNDEKDKLVAMRVAVAPAFSAALNEYKKVHGER